MQSFSGPDEIAQLVQGELRDWYELAIFQDSINIESIQRILVEAKNIKLEENETPTAFSYALLRGKAGTWIVKGNSDLEI